MEMTREPGISFLENSFTSKEIKLALDRMITIERFHLDLTNRLHELAADNRRKESEIAEALDRSSSEIIELKKRFSEEEENYEHA